MTQDDQSAGYKKLANSHDVGTTRNGRPLAHMAQCSSNRHRDYTTDVP